MFNRVFMCKNSGIFIIKRWKMCTGVEDIFLRDEANEARELERVIEGDEYDERPRSLSPSDNDSDNDKKDDEAEEDKRRVDPSSTKAKRVTKNPRFILNPARLTGPRGIQVIPEHFKDFKFKGKGHEKEDLDMVLKKLEHWAYRLYPKFQFEDCLKKIETLGKKRSVMVHLHKIRTDQFLSEETVVQKDSSDDEGPPQQEEDEFDKLLQQQIELARATPAPGSVKKPVNNDQWNGLVDTPRNDRSHLMMPKATSSPSISDEQRERMLKNRKLAEERRLARLKKATDTNTNTTVHNDEKISSDNPNITENEDNINSENFYRKINRSNVIDSSDSEEECVVQTNQSIEVDIHTNTNISNSNLVIDNKTQEKDINDTESMDINNEEQNDEKFNNEITKNNQENYDNLENKKNDYEINEVDVEIVEKERGNVQIDKINEEKTNETEIVDKNNSNMDNIEEKNKSNHDINNDVQKTIEIDDNLKSANLSNEETTGQYAEDMMDVDFSEDF